MIIIFFLIFFLIPALGYIVYRNVRRNVSTSVGVYEYILIVCATLSLILFVFCWMLNGSDYDEAIDIVDGGYTPIATVHSPTLVVFYALSTWGIIVLWLRGNRLPPLLFVMAIIFILISCVISIALIGQLLANTEQSDMGLVFLLFPFFNIVISISLLTKIAGEEREIASSRTYKKKYLNQLNDFMARSQNKPFVILVLCVPVFIVIVAILTLFGQDYNSITKAFTETTTWNFSQQTHPPFLEHKGHYLFTVAVCGDPRVVKPLRLGKRHGHEIVVNRQLLIANAFEQLIEESAPRLHKIIRNAYDKYGYPLSKEITTAKGSNLVYRLMKPLEYFFLVVLYLCCSKPEVKISKQYAI